MAERMDGETMTEFLSHASTLALADTLNAARALVATRLLATALPARDLRAKTAELVTADIVLDGAVCKVESAGGARCTEPVTNWIR